MPGTASRSEKCICPFYVFAAFIFVTMQRQGDKHLLCGSKKLFMSRGGTRSFLSTEWNEAGLRDRPKARLSEAGQPSRLGCEFQERFPFCAKERILVDPGEWNANERRIADAQTPCQKKRWNKQAELGCGGTPSGESMEQNEGTTMQKYTENVPL